MPSLMAIIGGNAQPLAKEFARVEAMAHHVGKEVTHSLMSAAAPIATVAGIEETVRRIQAAREFVAGK